MQIESIQRLIPEGPEPGAIRLGLNTAALLSPRSGDALCIIPVLDAPLEKERKPKIREN